MSAEFAFLRDIVARPEEPALRLIFADWLEENGQFERAEFQRLWCRLAGLPGDHPNRPALEKRQQQLRRARVKTLCSGPVGKEVLTVLDEGGRTYEFPMLDNGYVYPVDVRLSAYGDRSRWALAIDWMGAVNRNPSFVNTLCCFGNCLTSLHSEQSFRSSDAYQKWKTEHRFCESLNLEPVEDGPSGPLLDPDGWMDVNSRAQDLKVRGRVFPIPRDPALYRARDVGPEGWPRLRLQELMRCLAPDLRPLLVATEEEIHRLIPAYLPRLLRLDEWRHPNLADDQLPSRVETFRMIAAVLASGDPAYYRPPRRSNTHWSNWPMGGTL